MQKPNWKTETAVNFVKPKPIWKLQHSCKKEPKIEPLVSVMHRTWGHSMSYIFTESHSCSRDARIGAYASVCILHMHTGIMQPACTLHRAPGGPHCKTWPRYQRQCHAMLTMITTSTTATRNTDTFNFYRAMHVVLARYCYRKSSVRLSVRL